MPTKEKIKVKVYPLYGDLMFKFIFGYQSNARFTANMLENFLI